MSVPCDQLRHWLASRGVVMPHPVREGFPQVIRTRYWDGMRSYHALFETRESWVTGHWHRLRRARLGWFRV